MATANGAAQAKMAGHKPDWELVPGPSLRRVGDRPAGQPAEGGMTTTTASQSESPRGLTAQEQSSHPLTVDI